MGGDAVSVDTANPPHGGRLVDLLVEPHRAAELRVGAAAWPSWRLTHRQLCDLELLACGGFSPLRSFLGKDDHRTVCEGGRLTDGTLWPIPVTLDVPGEMATRASAVGTLALRDAEGVLLAALHVSESWRPDLRAEALAVFGSTDLAHPGVAHLLKHTYPCYITGALEVVQLPSHPDFRPFRRTPAEVRAEFTQRGWSRVIAFQTRNPMHQAHQELTRRAILTENANLLIHPVVGVTKPGDIDACTRVRCYQAILPSYPEGRVMLSLLPLAMRMGGPREALWHAIIRKNYGATHFIVGRDHASPGIDSEGRPFYGPYEGQELLRHHAAELGMRILPFKPIVYIEDTGAYAPADEAPSGARVHSISGTQLKRWLAEGRDLPFWYTAPQVAAELRRSYAPTVSRHSPPDSAR